MEKGINWAATVVLSVVLGIIGNLLTPWVKDRLAEQSAAARSLRIDSLKEELEMVRAYTRDYSYMWVRIVMRHSFILTLLFVLLALLLMIGLVGDKAVLVDRATAQSLRDFRAGGLIGLVLVLARLAYELYRRTGQVLYFPMYEKMMIEHITRLESPWRSRSQSADSSDPSSADVD